jgi:hypothetical protein
MLCKGVNSRYQVSKDMATLGNANPLHAKYASNILHSPQ